MEFVGYNDIDIVCDATFKLGEFSHYNNPIWAILPAEESNLATARLDIGISGAASVNLPVFIQFEETPNIAPCEYGDQPVGSGACNDRVTYSVTPQTFIVNGQSCELTIKGFADCNSGDGNATEGEFITYEGGVANRTCLWGETNPINPSTPATPPPISCPVGYTLVDTISGEVAGSTPEIYNYTAAAPSEILLQGWAMEGAPDLGCSVSGDNNWLCRLTQSSENFDIYVDSTIGRSKIGEYRDNGGAGNLEHYYFHAGPFQINVDTGPYSVELDHAGPITWHDIGYRFAVCSKSAGISTTRDFGDAPSPYSSASAIATVGLTIGTENIDSENAMIRNADALGDDQYGNDDENGVFFQDGGPQGNSSENKSVVIDVVNSAVPTAYLYGWIDYNRNGSFENSEKIIDGDTFVQSASAVNRTYAFDIPAGIGCGTTYARFRLDSTPINLASGDGNQGEIEDYIYQLCESDKDYGDAPVSFGTASHTWVPGIRLGANIDTETGSLNSATADGDDNNREDDEDGIEFIDGNVFEQGVTGYRIRATALNQWHTDEYLQGWIDFDQNGQFDHPAELLFSPHEFGLQEDPQTAVKTFDIPADAACGVTFARFRLSSDPIGPTGDHHAGEVEDYQVEINCTDPTQEPPVVCPAGHGQIGLFSGDIGGSGNRDTYNFDMTFDGPFFAVGYVKEGHPEDPCSLTGTEPSDGSRCSQNQNNENLDIYQSSGGVETLLGSYRDQQGLNGWENFYLEVGPYQSTFAPIGTNQFIVESLTGHSVGYKFALCEGDPGVTTSEQDLSVTVDGPANIGPTESFNWTFTVQNLSVADDGKNVQFSSSFPSEIILDSLSMGTPADWTCTTGSGTINCSANVDLPPGYSSTFVAGVTVPSVYSSTEIRNVVQLVSNPSDPVANQFNNRDEAVTSVVQADLSIDITADKDPIFLEETMTWSAYVSNDNNTPAYVNDATNPRVVVNIPPEGVYINHSTYNGWSCTFSGTQATCTNSSLNHGTSDQKVIDVFVRVPGTYIQDTITASAEITSDTYDPVSSNNTDAVTSNVDRTWVVPDGLSSLISPYTHIRFADTLNSSGNSLDQEFDFAPETYIESLLQIPLDASFAISASGRPELTVKYCTTPGNTGECSSPDAIIGGHFILNSVTYDTLIYQVEDLSGNLIDDGSNFVTTPITIELGIDANPVGRNGRYIVDTDSDCQAVGNPAAFENTVDCLIPFDDTRTTIAEPQPTLYGQTFEWQLYEYLAISSETKGGRPVIPPVDRGANVSISEAKPGLYKLSGSVSITVIFEDSRLGPTAITFDLPAYPVSAYFEIIAPFTEPAN